MTQIISYAPLSGQTLCSFDVTESEFVCKRCGIRIPTSLFPKGRPLVECANPAKPQPSDPPAAGDGLGDIVANALDSIGITKDRVQAIANRVGIRDCGCKSRQAAMNSFGQKYLGIGKPKVEKPIDSP